MTTMTPVDAEVLYATCSASGDILYRNPAWVSVFGRDADSWARLMPNDQSQMKRCLREAAAGSLVTHQLVSVCLPDREEPLPVLLDFLPAFRSQVKKRQPVALVVITGEVLAEPSSWTHSQTQRNRFETLGRMTMGIAHDFNNLLSGIMGYTELLKSAAASDTPPVLAPNTAVYDHLQTIEKAALDGANLVNKIQQYIRQEKRTRFEPVKMNAIIRDCVSLTRPYWYNEPRRQGIEIRTELDLDDIPYVMGSASELREVFVNLILNAVQAMPKGGTITVVTRYQEDEGVTVTIADTGIGMREDIQEQVFEPLFTTKGERGSGMGLAVTHGIIQEHEGTIALDSQLGHGTTFTLTFPPAEEAMPPPFAPEQEVRVESARILVVDDEQMVRSVLEKLLTLKGHFVRLAASGAEALQIIEEEHFDLVFTDHGMPQMNGRELADHLRRHYPNLPLVLLTGDTEVDEAEEIVDRVLSKPFQIEELQMTIQELL